MFKKIALLLGLMTSMLFSLSAQAAVDATDPNALVDMAAKQTFARLKADQAQIKSNPDHLRVIIREELLPYVDNRFAAYKVLGNQIKQTTPAQRDAFVEVFTEYMVSSTPMPWPTSTSRPSRSSRARHPTATSLPSTSA